MISITAQNIKENFGASYYLRGVEYYTRKKVQGYKVIEAKDDLGEDYVEIVSRVAGTGGRTYAQRFEIYREIDDFNSDRVVIDGECSCPVEYNCKHIAAVCIAYQKEYQVKKISKVIDASDRQSEHDERALKRWLENLTEAVNEENQSLKTDENGYFLTYRLDGRAEHYGGQITCYKSKFLKNGNISKGTKLDMNKVFYQYNYSDLKNKEDENILKMLSAFLPREYYASLKPLSGTLGAIVVKEVLATDRCYFENNLQPLKLLDGLLHVRFEFKHSNGQYSLESNLHKERFRVIETNPPFVLDMETNSVQEADIDIEHYKQLVNAPKFQQDAVAKVYTTIAKRLPAMDITTHKEVLTKKIKASPIPHLHLQYVREDDDKEFHSFYVEFDYAGYKTSYYPQKERIILFENDQMIELQRDLQQENLAKQQLEAFGFSVSIKNNRLYVALDAQQKQIELKIWKEFLTNGIEKLKDNGWIIEMDESFCLKFEPSSEIVVESEEGNNWFNLAFNIEFNGTSEPIAPLVASIIEEFDSFDDMPELINIEVAPNHFVELPTKQIEPIIRTIIELFDKKESDERLKISPYDAHLLEFMDDDIVWHGSKDILELSKKLKDFQGVQNVHPSKSLHAKLRDYQQEGLNWLNFLYEFNFSGILADDMGLGKTIQTLAHLSRLKEQKSLRGPSLIVMPTSLIANWKNEIKKFTPNLELLALHGTERATLFEQITEYDVILTTYGLVVRDQEKLREIDFFYIILDEAQRIKNHKTKMAVALKSFKSQHRLALSGTPIENHLGELWSIFSFLMPGFLDTNSFFRKYYQIPIEKEHNFERQNILNKRIKPFVLRRTKEIVASELPAKTEIVKYTQFGEKQAKLYESIRVTMEKKVQDAISAKGIGSSHITILDALLKLRQVCCDPSLLKVQEAQKIKESAKLELFLDLVEELLEEGRKILVFSQFTSMLSIIEAKIKSKKILFTKLTGATRKREEAIEAFTKGDAQIFLISLKAGGVGLNLTEADTVIHYDPWWNPAVENQATDRAYRIGQNKAVFVYKLIVENSIEQKILELQKKKKSLQDGIYDDNQQQEDLQFKGDELLELLKI